MGLRAWNVNSSGPAGVINLSSPTLRVWCLVSRVLVSATFLEAPARSNHAGPLSYWTGLGHAEAKEPRDEGRGAPPDGIPGSLSDRCFGQAQTGLIGGTTNLPGGATG